MANIPLRDSDLSAIVDDDDLPRVRHLKWRPLVTERGLTYAVASAGGGAILLHRLILRVPEGVIVDHRNRDGLDCRKENLRPATEALNQANSVRKRQSASGYRGVIVRRDKFQARIGKGGKLINLGVFDTAAEAGVAYDQAARAEFGAFARLNFPE